MFCQVPLIHNLSLYSSMINKRKKSWLIEEIDNFEKNFVHHFKGDDISRESKNESRHSFFSLPKNENLRLIHF